MSIKAFGIWHESRLLKEVSELFDREGFNDLFYDGIRRLHAEHPFEQREWDRLLRFDYVGYIDRSLRSSGFRDHDLDSMVHDLVVQMAVVGGLFRNYQKGQPFLPRFITAVRNGTINLSKRRRVRTRRFSDTPVDEFDPAGTDAETDTLTDEFRSYVRTALGNVAVRVLDHRLNDGDTKDLVGEPELETSYRVKQMVKRLKIAAKGFAQSHHEPELYRRVIRAFEDEQQTLSRRFAGSRS